MSKRYFFILFISTLTSCHNGEDLTKIKFGKNPRYAISKSELEELINSPKRLKEKQAIIRTADNILKKELFVPEEGGQWCFYYACKDDASSLKPLTLKKHKCPKCGKIYTDKMTCAAYMTNLHHRLNNQMLSLAKAYAVTGDDKYVIPVKKAFFKLVKIYPTLGRHDRWGRTGIFAVVGGRRYCQHLSEAHAAITLAKAYDLCRNSKVLSPKDRKIIADGYLKKTVNEIMSYEFFVGRKNNHQTWFNAAYANVGVATGDKKLIKEAVNGKGGLLWQMKNSVTSDGMWFEGTMSYHFYAIEALIETLKPLHAIGLDFSGNKTLKSLWSSPINLAFPNGDMPAINDSDPFNLYKKKNISKYYQFAYDYFKDPVFLNYTGDKNVPSRIKTLKSVDLPGLGIAVLRRGKDENAIACYLDYGLHGGGHGHPDKLNLIVYALDREIILDPGRIGYRTKEYTSWARTTVAHNTVVYNCLNQAPCKGKLLYFKDTKNFSACLAKCDYAYSGIDMKRFLCLSDKFLVDAFQVKGSDDSCLLDWIVHSRGKLTCNQNMEKYSQALGKTNGYQHLTDIKKLTVGPSVSFKSTGKDGNFITITPLNELGEIFSGIGIGAKRTEKVPFILIRKTSANALFIVVYDLSGNGSAFDKISSFQIKNKQGQICEDIAGLIIKGQSLKYRIGFDFRDSVDKNNPPKIDNKTFERLFFEITE